MYLFVQDCALPSQSLSLQNENLDVVENFTYLGSVISKDGNNYKEVSSRIVKARAVFANLRHLWRQKGISLELKGRVYNTTVRAVLLYASETLALRSEDLRRLQTFDNRCLRSVARITWHRKVSNVEVRRRIFGNAGIDDTLEKRISLHRLRWLGHVLRMSANRLPNKVLFSQPGQDWRRVQGGQILTWQRQMKSETQKLSKIGPVRLPGWDYRAPPYVWLETLRDMALNRSQWRACCQHIVRSLA